MGTQDNLVVIGVDDNVVYPAAVLLHSLAKGSKNGFRVEVGFFDGHLSENHRNNLGLLCKKFGIECEFILFPFHPDLFDGKRHISSTTYLKFLFADRIQDVFLWVDVDMIALDNWDDVFIHIDKADLASGLVVARKLNPAAQGFNAGFLGWPARAKRESWAPALKTKDADSFSVEQDVFNSLYKGRLTWLPVDYNFVSLWASHGSEIPESTKFLHFAGPLKPWFLEKHQAKACSDAGCPWGPWFLMESSLHESSELQEFQTLVKGLRIQGLNSFNSYTKSLRSFRLALMGRKKLVWIVLKYLFIAWARTLGRGKSFGNLHPFHLGPSRNTTTPKPSI